MAITSTLTTSFKKELLTGTHDFTNSTGDSFKLALYTSSATLGATTTAYTTTGEASGTNYTAGGAALTNVTPTSSGTTGFTDFADLTFGTATITARGCLIYNDTEAGDPAVAPNRVHCRISDATMVRQSRDHGIGYRRRPLARRRAIGGRVRPGLGRRRGGRPVGRSGNGLVRRRWRRLSSSRP